MSFYVFIDPYSLKNFLNLIYNLLFKFETIFIFMIWIIKTKYNAKINKFKISKIMWKIIEKKNNDLLDLINKVYLLKSIDFK